MRYSWKVNRCYGPLGPWVIQRAQTTKGGGLSFDLPIEGHTHFKTKRHAEEFKRKLGPAGPVLILKYQSGRERVFLGNGEIR